MQTVLDESCSPRAVEEQEISKDDGGIRVLGILCVLLCFIAGPAAAWTTTC